jgi:vancomycin resistance protein YoaR
VVVLLALGGAYSLLAWWSSTRVPQGVEVAGIDIGGMSEGQARRTLEDQLVARAALPLRLEVNGTEQTISPADAGLQVDVDATVDEVVGFSWDPRVLFRQVAGETDVPAETDVDGRALRASIDALADQVDTEPVDASISFAGGAAVPVAPVAGVALDVDGSVQAVRAGWPQSGPAIELPAEVTEPAVDQADLDEAMTSFATPATAGPVTVAVGSTSVALTPEQLAPALSVTAQDGELVPAVDAEVLKAALLAVAPTIETPTTDASISLRRGVPVVVPAVEGVTVDAAQLATAVQAAFTSPDRVAAVATAVREPELTTAEAQALGVTEVVSEFATNLTADAGRTENIQIAARTVNGTLLLPGETFSLNGTLGERTPEKGYNEAPVILNGRLSIDYGGGVSQVATTLFNGMFFAGLEDVEHKPHSFYISRYPEGREATVNWNNVDLKFTNDSPYGVYIEMYVAGGQVHTRFWSTKVWDVEAVKGPRTNVKEPGVDTGSGPKCVPQAPQAGFDVTVTRIFSQGGAEKKREEFRTRYIPEDRITCTG